MADNSNSKQNLAFAVISVGLLVGTVFAIGWAFSKGWKAGQA